MSSITKGGHKEDARALALTLERRNKLTISDRISSNIRLLTPASAWRVSLTCFQLKIQFNITNGLLSITSVYQCKTRIGTRNRVHKPFFPVVATLYSLLHLLFSSKVGSIHGQLIAWFSLLSQVLDLTA